MVKQAFNGQTLYHCVNREPEGDALQPTCLRNVNGRTEKYLFATPYLSKALAFAFDYHNGEIICNGSVDGTPDEFAIVCNRSETLNAPRHIRVFSFSGKNFEQAYDAESHQCVSTHPVPFKDTKTVLETQNIDDLMRGGLQIFSTEKQCDELLAEDFFGRAGQPAATNIEWLRNLVKDEGFVWENKERGVNPNQALTDFFDAKPKTQQQVIQPTTP
jgi:hypothetical protein